MIRHLLLLGFLILFSSETATGREPISQTSRVTVGSYTLGFSLLKDLLTSCEAPWLRVVALNNSEETVPRPIVALNGPVLSWKLVDESGNDLPCSVMEGLFVDAFHGEMQPGDSVVEYQQFGWDSWHESLQRGRYAVLVTLDASALDRTIAPGKLTEFVMRFEVLGCDSTEDVGMELLRVADSLMRDKRLAEYADTCLQIMKRYPGSLAARIAFRYAYYVARHHPDLIEVDWRDMAREFVIENCELPACIGPARNLSHVMGHSYVDSLIEVSVRPTAAHSPLYEVELHFDE